MLLVATVTMTTWASDRASGALRASSTPVGTTFVARRDTRSVRVPARAADAASAKPQGPPPRTATVLLPTDLASDRRSKCGSSPAAPSPPRPLARSPAPPPPLASARDEREPGDDARRDEQHEADEPDDGHDAQALLRVCARAGGGREPAPRPLRSDRHGIRQREGIGRRSRDGGRRGGREHD